MGIAIVTDKDRNINIYLILQYIYGIAQRELDTRTRVTG